MKKSAGDHVFDGFNMLFMALITFVCLYPFWYVFAVSINDNMVSSFINVVFWPRKATFFNYQVIFQSPWLVSGYRVSVLRTVIATFFSVLLSGAMAFALSRKNLLGRTFWNVFILIPMYLSGGLIPMFLLVKNLGMYDTFAALILPGLISTWNTILLRTSIMALPDGLIESANIDGANDIRIYFQIVIPVAKPIFATITLFVAVAFWNDWFAGEFFIRSESLRPIQTIMLSIINSVKASDMAKKMAGLTGTTPGTLLESVKMASVMLTVLPIVMVYPFLQKYFVKGIMIGSLKG